MTNDCKQAGGNGYTVFIQGTDVPQKGDLQLDGVARTPTARPSPVAAVVEGRNTGL